METKGIDYSKLNKALENYNSLQEATDHLFQEKLTLEKKNKELKHENDKLESSRNKLTDQEKDLKEKITGHENTLGSLYRNIQVLRHQYELFCGFLAMLKGSPSVTDSIDTLIAIFQTSKEQGWRVSKDPDRLRNSFIIAVMGDFLKSYSCVKCGAQFIVNKPAKHRGLGSGYYCPVCELSLGVIADDSFLKAMTSPEQPEVSNTGE